MHRKKGICQIKDIRSEDFCGTGKETYYIMRSVNDDSSMIYVPQSSHQIRDIMTKEQIEAVVNETEHLEGQWIDDSRARASAFDKILRNGASSDILWLMKVLSIHYHVQQYVTRLEIFTLKTSNILMRYTGIIYQR